MASSYGFIYLVVRVRLVVKFFRALQTMGRAAAGAFWGEPEAGGGGGGAVKLLRVTPGPAAPHPGGGVSPGVWPPPFPPWSRESPANFKALMTWFLSQPLFLVACRC